MVKVTREQEGMDASYGLRVAVMGGGCSGFQYDLSLAEKSTEKILFKEPSFVFRQPYNVLGSSKSYYDREREAIEALARPFAQSLVTTILEGF